MPESALSGTVAAATRSDSRLHGSTDHVPESALPGTVAAAATAEALASSPGADTTCTFPAQG